MSQRNVPLKQYLEGVSPLVYGCMGLGGDWNHTPLSQMDIQHSRNAIDAAIDSGINLFDLADIYKFGKSEQVFGRYLQENPAIRNRIFIQSKVGIRLADEEQGKRYDLSKEWILTAVDQILDRLNTEFLDVLLLHRPDPLMEPEQVAEAFDLLNQDGRVRHFGVSNMNEAQINLLQHWVDQPLIVNQVHMSLGNPDWIRAGIDPSGNSSRFSSGLLPYCQQNGIQLQAWGCMDQGLYCGRDISNSTVEVQRTAEKVRQLSDIYSVSKESIVLAWLLRHPAGIQPVIGATNPGRIAACRDATEIELSREHWYELLQCSLGTEIP